MDSEDAIGAYGAVVRYAGVVSCILKSGARRRGCPIPVATDGNDVLGDTGMAS